MKIFTRIEDTGLLSTEQSRKIEVNSFRCVRVFCWLVFLLLIAFLIIAEIYFPSPEDVRRMVAEDQAQLVSTLLTQRIMTLSYFILMIVLCSYALSYTLGQLPHQRNEKRAIEYAIMKDSLELAKNHKCVSDAFKTKIEGEATKYFIELAKDWRLTPEQLGLDTKASGSDTITIDPNIIFDPTHPRYSPELAGALATWLSFEFNPLPSGLTPKTEITARLRDWAQDHNAPFSTKAEERISIVTNWDKNGNKY